MESNHYNYLFDLMKEKINRLENDKDQQRKEIGRLKREIRELKKQAGGESIADAE